MSDIPCEGEPFGQVFGSSTGYWCRLVDEDFDREIRISYLPDIGLFLDLYSDTFQNYRKVKIGGNVLTGSSEELIQVAQSLSVKYPAQENH